MKGYYEDFCDIGQRKNKANQTQFWQPGSLNIRGEPDKLLPVRLSGVVERKHKENSGLEKS
jgi:hypothetical protein